MQGRRIYPDESGHLQFSEGDYGQQPNGDWMARPPGCHLGSLKAHTVVEHEDGTITVSPSILLTDYDDDGKEKKWHGYLERGVWREV